MGASSSPTFGGDCHSYIVSVDGVFRLEPQPTVRSRFRRLSAHGNRLSDDELLYSIDGHRTGRRNSSRHRCISRPFRDLDSNLSLLRLIAPPPRPALAGAVTLPGFFEYLIFVFPDAVIFLKTASSDGACCRQSCRYKCPTSWHNASPLAHLAGNPTPWWCSTGRPSRGPLRARAVARRPFALSAGALHHSQEKRWPSE